MSIHTGTEDGIEAHFPILMDTLDTLPARALPEFKLVPIPHYTKEWLSSIHISSTFGYAPHTEPSQVGQEWMETRYGPSSLSVPPVKRLIPAIASGVTADKVRMLSFPRGRFLV